MTIQVLGPDVASKIAAGEVVERPASVVKELIDNSLDAGSTQISVETHAGGVKLIRVVDNGSGIPRDEIDFAFKRFATSKINAAEDLEHIVSLGFRGEALPSIAAVSDVTMVSRSEDELSGTFVNVREGQILQKTKRGCPVGTTVTVRNLFRSFPARLKFLKSTLTEAGHISHLVAQYSLAFPEVRFTLVTDGRTTFRSPGSGDLREALATVYGPENAKMLLEVLGMNEGSQLPLVTGFISPPSLTRSGRNYMSFFVNRRWVQNRMLSYAVEEAYHGLLLTGRHPIAVINIRVPTQEVDVNVHPAKSEIRFSHERDIFLVVKQAVRDTLVARAPMPSLNTLYSPSSRPPLPTTEPFAALSTATVEAVNRPPVAEPPQTQPVFRSLPILRVIGQVASTYIITEGPDGMYLVDQHAAHERVLFERIRDQQQRKAVEAQGMLQPLSVELTQSQMELLELHSKLLSEYGFTIEGFGERTCVVRSIPLVLRGQNVEQFLIELLDILGKGSRENWQEEIVNSLACHSAILAGQTLTLQEMQDLIRQLEQTSQPRNCPHGRPTMVHLSAAHLEKVFGRR